MFDSRLSITYQPVLVWVLLLSNFCITMLCVFFTVLTPYYLVYVAYTAGEFDML